MGAFDELFGGLGGDAKPNLSPRVIAALDRIAEASELSAAIAARDMFRVDENEGGAERMSVIVSKLARRLARRHEGVS